MPNIRGAREGAEGVGDEKNQYNILYCGILSGDIVDSKSPRVNILSHKFFVNVANKNYTFSVVEN